MAPLILFILIQVLKAKMTEKVTEAKRATGGSSLVVVQVSSITDSHNTQ
jgi:hypothetical protein